MRGPGESALDAAKRVCKELDGGVLPVQGPPGSGKTYVGASAIAELARTKKVGVTLSLESLLPQLHNIASLPLPFEDDPVSTP